MKKILQTKNVYLLLLPLFFVLHGYTANLGFIAVTDCLLLLLTYFAASLLIFGLLFLFFRDSTKAALLSVLLLSFYFFFGAIQDFLQLHAGFLHKYSVLLTLFLLVLSGVAWWLKKSNGPFTRARLLLNSLLIIYILIDIAGLCLRLWKPSTDKFSVYGFDKQEKYLACDSCSNPDIYFLVFDEYSSTSNLATTFHYDNSALDSFLLKQQFQMQTHSFSNYNFTPFSVASLLNMDYIRGIQDPASVNGEDYLDAEKLIKNNAVIRFLSSRNYDVVNYSIFDLAGNPSQVEVSLLPVKTRLITAQTFFARFMRDIGWHFDAQWLPAGWGSSTAIYNNLSNNNKLLQLTKDESRKKAKRPRFIYAHFEMPHWPFYFGPDNRLRERSEMVKELYGAHPKAYTGYLPYTNEKLQQLILAIQEHTAGRAVIILMGDHGYRVPMPGVPDTHYFKNLNAVYFPGKDYHLLQDSSSGVNQFRIVFNTIFKQSFPLLKDSSVFLRDKIK